MNEFRPVRLGGRVKLITIAIITVCSLAFCALVYFGLFNAELAASIDGPSWLVVAFISLAVFLFWWYLGWRLKPRAYVLEMGRIIIKRSSPYRDRYFELLPGTTVERVDSMPDFCMHLWSASMPFSMSGSYLSLGKGVLRAYTTTTRNCILIDNGKRRLYVSPESMDQFEVAIKQLINGVSVSNRK